VRTTFLDWAFFPLALVKAERVLSGLGTIVVIRHPAMSPLQLIWARAYGRTYVCHIDAGRPDIFPPP